MISCEYAKKWECKSIWNVANCNQIETEVCTKKRKQILYKWEYNILFGGKYLYAAGTAGTKQWSSKKVIVSASDSLH